MKKHIVALIVFILLLSGCLLKKDEMTYMNINPDKVEQIRVSTQVTDVKQDIAVASKDLGDLVNKLNSYPLKKINAEKSKGWQYLFTIVYSDGGLTYISFMENLVIWDDSIYEVKDYNTDDFLYLFQ
jgi:hypothetical protein